MPTTEKQLVEFHNRIDNSRCEIVKRRTEDENGVNTTYHLICHTEDKVEDWGPQSYHQVWESFRAVTDMALEAIGDRQ